MDPLLPAEAEAQADGPVVVPLVGQPITVPPMWQWPRQGLAALLADEDDLWADYVLAKPDRDLWLDTDTTVEELDDFWIGWQHTTGQSVEQIGRMVAILAEHRDRLESDLVAYCNGTDLRHLWMPHHGPSRLTWRRLAVLYDGLPPESLTKTAQVDALDPAELASMAKKDRDGFGPFSRTDMLIADLVDAVNLNTYILRLANTDKAKQKSVKPPEPVYRPGVTPRKRRTRASVEAQRLLEHMRANRGAAPTGWRDVPHPAKPAS